MQEQDQDGHCKLYLELDWVCETYVLWKYKNKTAKPILDMFNNYSYNKLVRICLTIYLLCRRNLSVTCSKISPHNPITSKMNYRYSNRHDLFKSTTVVSISSSELASDPLLLPCLFIQTSTILWLNSQSVSLRHVRSYTKLKQRCRE